VDTKLTRAGTKLTSSEATSSFVDPKLSGDGQKFVAPERKAQ
jgi:hypothetical protein